MKTLILPFALLCCAAFAETAITGAIKAVSAGDAVFFLAATPIKPTATATYTASYAIVWMDSESHGGNLLAINGITEIKPLGPSNYLFYTLQRRPEKPEEIKVELWTKDGKHWVAEWKEVK